ncbi:MAG: hypothetical protein ACRCVU_12210 [Flavobacterium sp.]
MRTYQLLFFIIFSFIGYSQETNYIITYQINYSINTKSEWKDKLYIDSKNNKSIYIVSDKHFPSIAEEDKDPDIIHITENTKP